AAASACSRGTLARPSVVVTTIPRLRSVTAEPALAADTADWFTIAPLHLEQGRLNLEVTNRSGQEVRVQWGSARLSGLDGTRHGLDIMNLKLDARGQLPLPSRLPPYSAVQVRMVPDHAPRLPRTVADAAEAQQLCET